MYALKNIFRFLKNYLLGHKVLLVALICALITMVFVPIDKQYLTYFDMRTLTCLFCTLLVVGAFKNICLFEIIARKIVDKVSNLSMAFTVVVAITFIGSMILANDMALLTFLPLGYFVLKTSGNEERMAFLFIMQNIAANLGGMLTPFGNPQNLYLFSFFEIPTTSFIRIMFPPFICAISMIFLLCLTKSKKEVHLVESHEYEINIKKTIIYSILFFLSILVVFRIFPYYWGLLFITSAMLILDPKAFMQVDYALLLTFCCFFVFSSNLARIDVVNTFLSTLVAKNTLLVGVLSCQVMSNVPTAILLSKFTQNYPALLVAVNIGGCGTLIASLASLITFSSYRQYQPNKTKDYVFKFSLYNFSFLIILFIIEYTILYLV